MDRQVLASAALKTIWVMLLMVPIAGLAADNLHGTYSSLTYSNESGDLNGYEVEFIPTNKGLKAVVQVAEGEVDGIYVVDVVQSKDGTLSFSFPIGSQKVTFSGAANGMRLLGTLALPSGEQRVILKRGSGYWDQNLDNR
jgi:hypothetical protein